ncbi:EamA family transporter [Intrasporangium calvum]|nr:EamA family transporter [Intrasporangium calvum]
MPRRDVARAGLVAVIWGVNFVAIHASLEHYPPFLLAGLRFLVLAIPTVLFVRRPRVQWRWLLGYGLGFGILQFAFLYLGMAAGMPAGLSSLVLQASAPFTVVLAAVFLRERPGWAALAGVAVALTGLAVIAGYRGLAVSVVPVLLVLAGALGWAIGNLCSRQARPDSPFRLMMWMTVVPPVPLLALSFLVEGPERVAAALSGAPSAWTANLGLAYTVVLATIVGSGLWTSLLMRNSASSVAPFSMLVPVAGLTAAWLILGEKPSGWELLGGVLIVTGVLWPHLRRRAALGAVRAQRHTAGVKS